MPSRRTALASAAALIVLATAACQSTTEPVVTPEPTITGRWIGESWEGRADAALYAHSGSDTLYVFGTRRLTSGVEEWVRLRVKFRGVGTYVLNADAVSLDRVIGGDGIEASYQGIGATAGTLEITSFGPGGLVEGTFAFDARLARSASAPLVRFEDGRFSAPIVVRP